MKKSSILYSALAFGVSLTALGTAFAQVAEAPAGQIEDVIVTARRFSESIQTTPVTLTNFDSSTLEKRSILNVSELGRATPSMAVVTAAATKYAAAISIRGQVQRDNLMTVDPSVGVYVDDIYYARAYAILTDLLDVSSVEVLKGPQGTLYGRNTIGGAVKITTNHPDVSSGYTGFLKLSVGNYNAFKVSGAITIPLVADKLAVRYAGAYSSHDGYTKTYVVNQPNLTPVRTVDTDNENSNAHRLSVTFKPSDSWTFLLSGSAFNAKDNGAMTVNRPGDVQRYTAGNATASVFSNSPQRAADFYSALSPRAPFSSLQTRGLTFNVTYDINDTLSTKLLLGYLKAHNFSGGNAAGTVSDGLAFVQFFPALEQHQRQYSAEYQLSGKAFDKKLSWIAGLYYFDEKGGEDAQRGLSQTFVLGNNSSTFFNGDVHNKSKSVFANAIYNWTDALRTSAGVRYTSDDKAIQGRNRSGVTLICVYSAGAGVTTSTTPGGPCLFDRTDTFNYATWEVSADYRFTPDIFGYAKVGNGYRSGGQQLRSVGGQSITPFSPDQVINAEGGVKADLLDRRLRVNAAYYHTYFKNTQQTIIALISGTTTTLVANQGTAKVDGMEVEATARLGEQLTLSGSMGYADFRYSNAALLQVYSPKWTYSLSAVYTQPTPFGELSARLDYTHRGPINIDTSVTTPDHEIPGWGVLNGRVSLAMERGIELSVWSNNLTARKYYTSGLVSGFNPAFYGVHPANVGAPRTFGADLKYTF